MNVSVALGPGQTGDCSGAFVEHDGRVDGQNGRNGVINLHLEDHAFVAPHVEAIAEGRLRHEDHGLGAGTPRGGRGGREGSLVPDVNAQDNYIACSITVKSEIVIPLFVNGENIGQIDIDSHTPDPFTKADEDFLEWVNAQVAVILDV